MQQAPKQLTLERMRELFQTSDANVSSDIILGKDLSVIQNGSIFSGLLDIGGPFLIPDYRIGLVTEGQVRGCMNLTERVLDKGTLVFITPGSIIQPSETTASPMVTGMTVSPELMRLALNGAVPDIFNGQMMDGTMEASEEDAAFLLALFSLLGRELNSIRHSERVAFSIVSAIIYKFDALFAGQQQEQTDARNNERNIFDRFIYLVNKHCREEHQIKFYASKMCLSERYLGTVVKKASGTTAKEWIDRAIVTQAKMMLRHSNEQVSQIADTLSFPNYSFFNKFFKRMTGMTPMDYRKG